MRPLYIEPANLLQVPSLSKLLLLAMYVALLVDSTRGHSRIDKASMELLG
jgi:hypothetical protein